MAKDNLSLPIGATVVGNRYPVFFDPHFPIYMNYPPVSFISGSPGSGKTFAALLIATLASISNKMNVVIDPKGDFMCFNALKAAGYIPHANVWTIINPDTGEIDKENQGILDPTRIYESEAESVALTVDVVQQLVGELSNEQKVALTPIVQDVVADRKRASLDRVKQALLRNSDSNITAVGVALDIALKMRVGNLLSKPMRQIKAAKSDDVIKSGPGMTVISLMGLTLPPENKNPNAYTVEERVSVTVMWLITSVVLNKMKNTPKKIQKTLFIDEAWTLMNNPTTVDLISSIALLGRSLNVAFVLITQSPTHIERKNGQASLNSTISTRLAFRNTSDDDNRITIEAMKLPSNESWETLLPTFKTGTCLMQDTLGQTGLVEIMAPNKYIPIFNTNPLEALRASRKKS